MHPNIYSTNIESTIIKNIRAAGKSVTITMAWFTNKDILQALIDLKRSKPKINIRLLIDDNKINEVHFSISKEQLEQYGIQILPYLKKNLQHQKFMVIDQHIVLDGSYNYTKKANINSEHILLFKNRISAQHFEKLFNMYTDPDYIDPNINLLFRYPEFARDLLSTYYTFRQPEAKIYSSKVRLGGCFTHENGYHDVLTYYPGVIFNTRYHYFNGTGRQKFSLPINKYFILNWNKSNHQNILIDAYRPYPKEYHRLSKVILDSEKILDKIYQEKLSHMYSTEDLEKFILDKTDIVMEPELWQLNFEPFISQKIARLLFSSMTTINEIPADSNFF